MTRNLTLSIVIALVSTSCYYNDVIPPNQNVWPIAHPEHMEMESELLLQMDSVLKGNTLEGITSVVVIKDGHLVFENYYFGYDRRTLFPLGGLSSSLVNLALGRAIDMGLIDSVQDSIYKYFPEYVQLFEDSPLKKNITFENLMTMKAGLSWNEIGSTFDRNQSDITQILISEDWVEYLLSKPVDVLPGRRFTYNSAMAILIASAIDSQYEAGYQVFWEKEVLSQMGVTHSELAIEGGNINPAWGISMTTLDLAKIGYLYLHQGNWFGQQLINREYAISSVVPQVSVDFINQYGWMWWQYASRNNFLYMLDENDVFFATGNGDQRLYVVPHLDLVVAITGSDEIIDFSIPASFIFRDYILLAMQ
ncbi:beta-lactamase family protein [Reichenbachiella carrageenanivorans]|uniref:Beta-lactamase family protein n=1 Tax=Reichenbachiella carrageenanivorans TaxID=2979869 RepID=A0ABY6D038_9BACT|nr:serine hydrolase [Reichenbachiella carrageenanivorans]UXX79299.1 beta-lactamase family protein [Reichenbachiella carrageenanivorans]